MNSLTTEEKALRVYNAHLKALKTYRAKNKDKLKQYYKTKYENLKNNEPEKYQEFLAKKKAYYANKKSQKQNETISDV